MNAPDSLDPRMLASRRAKAGTVLLKGEELPKELPRSVDPNCELQEGDDGESVLVVTLRPVAAGEALTVGAGEDEEYDEWR
jgi:hypothetical protein